MVIQAVIVVHIAAGLVAVIAGALAMLAAKRPGRHPMAGRIYLGGLAVLFASACAIAMARPHTAFLLILGIAALAAGAAGLAARRIRWPGWLSHHIIAMAGSYILALTAFYVDNGPRLPLWRLLPPVAFWFLPALVGLPLVVWALRRHLRAGTDARRIR